jgi:antitoxin (DNA-binding transcriptional repressor) of toxin-antitoxin stability system
MTIEHDYMARYNIAEAKVRSSELVDKAMAGEDVVIVRDHETLLRLIPYHDLSPLKPGSARGQIATAEDFDAPLDDLKKYM